MMLMPGACVITFGKMVRDRKQAAMEAAGQNLSLIHIFSYLYTAIILTCCKPFLFNNFLVRYL